MASQSVSAQRAAALRTRALSFANTISMELRSGEQAGRNRSSAPRASMAARALAFLWTLRLSQSEGPNATGQTERAEHCRPGSGSVQASARPRRRRMSHSAPLVQEQWQMPSIAPTWQPTEPPSPARHASGGQPRSPTCPLPAQPRTARANQTKKVSQSTPTPFRAVSMKQKSGRMGNPRIQAGRDLL